MIPHELSKSDIVKIIEQLDVLLPSTPLTNKAEVEKGLLRQGQLEILHLIEAMQHFVLIQNWVATTAAGTRLNNGKGRDRFWQFTATERTSLFSSLISHCRILVLRSAEASTRTNGHRATRM